MPTRWFVGYAKSLAYWRKALALCPKDASLPHWPLPLYSGAHRWPTPVFRDCECSTADPVRRFINAQGPLEVDIGDPWDIYAR
jgi:hypothetical protein